MNTHNRSANNKAQLPHVVGRPYTKNNIDGVYQNLRYLFNIHNQKPDQSLSLYKNYKNIANTKRFISIL